MRRNRKNKSGFTLIELLAIIVILAIIAVITVPVILNIIDKVKEGAIKNSALGYIDAVKKQIVINSMDETVDNDIREGTKNTLELENTYGVKVDGEKPLNNSTVTFTNGSVSGYTLYIGSYIITMDNGNVNTGKDVVSSVDITESRFALWVGETKQLHVTVSPSNVTNGSIRWSSGNSAVITVDENTGLVTAVGEGTTTLMASSIMDNTKTDTISVTVAPSSTVCVLDSTNPNTGYTNTLTVNSVSYLTGDKYRCKPWTTKPENQEEEYFNFYVLDANDSTDTISLLMDRNISGLETVDWSDATEYINGLEVTTCSGNNIRFAVTKWNRVDGVSLPTGLQIANAGKITGWTQVDTWSYFGSSTVNTVNTNRTNFAWLCDYTNFCKKRGKCNYQTTGGVYGYWTSTGYQTDSSPSAAWIVNDDGRLTYYDVSFTDYIGVRPVITLSSSKLSQ